MKVTLSEYDLIKRIINHLRTEKYASITIKRYDNTTHVENGIMDRLSVKYIGSVEMNTEKTTGIVADIDTSNIRM